MERQKRKLTPLGKRIVKELTDRDMTRQELAREIGASPVYLGYILRGERSGEKYLPAIAAVLGWEYDPPQKAALRAPEEAP